MSNKVYLGDGVYVDVDRDMVKLTTEDGMRATNTIYLEPEVFASLLDWWDAVRKEAARAR